ncbi:MAG: hypothetical protein AAB152_14270 [Candidatus Coatesbacteria bacterium]
MRRAALLIALVTGGWLAAPDVRAEGYQLLWTATYDGPAHRDDHAEDIALDPAGNVFVAGWTDRSDIGEDLNILVLKYSPTGTLLWTRTHNSFPGGMDLGFGIAVDSGGNCYVAGSVSITGGASEGWLRKYDTNGNVLWTLEYPSPSAGDQAVFRDVAVDEAGGNLYVAGCQGRGDLLQSGNALLVKVPMGGGVPVWAVDADGHGLWDEFLSVAVAPNGDVLVTGYEGVLDLFGIMAAYWPAIIVRTSSMYNPTLLSIDEDLVVCRYGPSGSPVWRRTYGSLNDIPLSRYTWDSGYGVSSGHGDSVVVSGTVARIGNGLANFDRLVRAWSGDGNSVLWTRMIDKGEGTYMTDAGFRCATGPDGRVLVAGYTAMTDSYRFGVLTLEQFDPSSGFTIHEDGYSGGYFLVDEGRSVAVDSSGGYVMAAIQYRTDLTQGYDALIRRWSGPAVPAQTAGRIVAYPNPFDPGKAVGGVFKFANLPPRANVRIWSLAGLLVSRVEVRGAGAAWDGRTGNGSPAAPGMYYYTVEAPGAKRVTGIVAVVRP